MTASPTLIHLSLTLFSANRKRISSLDKPDSQADGEGKAESLNGVSAGHDKGFRLQRRAFLHNCRVKMSDLMKRVTFFGQKRICDLSVMVSACIRM